MLTFPKLVAFGLRAVLASALLTPLVLGGCNRSSIKLYPVKGQVFYKKQPVAGAQVVLQPKENSQAPDAKDKKPMAYGTVADDGSVVLRSDFQGEGVAPGTYDVFITCYATDPKNPDRHFNKLPAKYADQAKPAFTVVVKEENNVLEPFQLN
jgi:hypothetical protein